MTGESIGAMIERGRVTEVSGETYRVESLERPGIVSQFIPGISDAVYSAGDTVYYFVFPDGTGTILIRYT